MGTTRGFQHTSSSTLFPNTRGPPAHNPGGGHLGGRNIIPMIGGPGIPAYNWDPPGQYTGGADGGHSVSLVLGGRVSITVIRGLPWWRSG